MGLPYVSTYKLSKKNGDIAYIKSLESWFEKLTDENDGKEVRSLNDTPKPGIYRLSDEEGRIPGVLCLDTGKPGPSVVINAMQHMNEPAGLAGQQAIFEQWEKDHRPQEGRIILTLGGDIDRAREYFGFLDHCIESTQLSCDEVVIDVDKHTEYRTTADGYNLNRVNRNLFHPEESQRKTPEKHEERTVRLVNMMNTMGVNGRLLDIHTYSNGGPPMIMTAVKDTEAHEKGNFDKVQIQRYHEGTDYKLGLDKICEGIPAKFNFLDGLDSFDPLTSVVQQKECCPLGVEVGGDHLKQACGYTAVKTAQAWVQNLLGPARYDEQSEILDWHNQAKNLALGDSRHFSALFVPPQSDLASEKTYLADTFQIGTPNKNSTNKTDINEVNDIYVIPQHREEVTALLYSIYNGLNTETESTPGSVMQDIIKSKLPSGASSGETIEEYKTLEKNMLEHIEPLFGKNVPKEEIESKLRGLKELKELIKNPIKNFNPMDEGDTLAVGLFTGHEVKLTPEEEISDQPNPPSARSHAARAAPESKQKYETTMIPKMNILFREEVAMGHKRYELEKNALVEMNGNHERAVNF